MDAVARPIWKQFETSDYIITLVLSDLDDQMARKRLGGDSGPSIAWEIGHLLYYRVRIMALLGQAGDNPYEGIFDGSSDAGDGARYPTVEEFGRQWKNRHAELERVLERTTAAQLEGPIPGATPHDERSLWDLIMFLVWHEAYHCGQIGSIRTHFGLPEISKVAAAQSQEE